MMGTRTRWGGFVMLSAAAVSLSVALFPHAFTVVRLDVRMDRGQALESARQLAAQERIGPTRHRQAVSFEADTKTQTFVELEGGGKDTFARLLRDGLYEPYTWQVRHFEEGAPHEALFRFRPDGRPYGFKEKLAPSMPGPSLTPGAARRIAEQAARVSWQIDLTPYTLLTSSSEQQPSGRADHTFVYQRRSSDLREGRYGLRLVVSGDHLSEATYFLAIPDTFTRRHAQMRAANEALGAAAVAVISLLYGLAAAIGTLYLARLGWAIVRPPMLLGATLAGVQLLVAVNDWPARWMTYQTMFPSAAFVATQAASVVLSFLGSTVAYGCAFMAAETLTRRAFGLHPQLWRVWSSDAAASTAVLGRTALAYLVVPLLLAWDVAFYWFTTQKLGWWAPSETMIRPDALTSQMPWLPVLANSLHAGLWEECLLRAVPLASAALMGERFGRRRLWIGAALVAQALLFGAGHASSPMQPSYMRVIELFPVAMAWGAIYLAFGLLPAIVCHFVFDMVWFSGPVFVGDAPGIWIARLAVITAALVPLLVVFLARLRRGSWGRLPAWSANAAWTPRARMVDEPRPPRPMPLVEGSSSLLLRTCVVAGCVGVLLWTVVGVARPQVEPLTLTRQEAERIAIEALTAHGVAFDPSWRRLAIPYDERGNVRAFLGAGGVPSRYRPTPHWRVRVATFNGDLDRRAEEWEVRISAIDRTAAIVHRIPASRPGATLAEADAKALAERAISQRLGIQPSALRQVSARSFARPSRMDWTFVFHDLGVPTADLLPVLSGRAEARIEVVLAGSEVTHVKPFLFGREDWTGADASRRSGGMVVDLLAAFLVASLLMTATVVGVRAWMRDRFELRASLATLALFTVVTVINAGNSWPVHVSAFTTSQSVLSQAILAVSKGVFASMLPAAAVALLAGAAGRWVNAGRNSAISVFVGVSLGAFDAGTSALTAVLRDTRGPAWPDVSPLASVSPWLTAALGGVPDYLIQVFVTALVLAGIDRLTFGWTRRRIVFGPLLCIVAIVLSGHPEGAPILRWLLSGIIPGATLLFQYLLLRADLSALPIAVGTTAAFAYAGQVWRPVGPDLAGGAVAAVVVTLAVSWWLFGLLRRTSADYRLLHEG